METKPKNRAWVKDAAIVFLVVLLLLTFFSNTIMNHSLPEVATNMVSNGTITAKVRGTGTVTANGNHKVKAKSNMTIGRVVVKAGQEVNAGDVLFVLGAADSTELEEAMIALEDLQTQYAQAALSVPLANACISEKNAMDQAGREYERAEKAYLAAVEENTAAGKSQKAQDLLKEKNTIEKGLSETQQKLDSIKIPLEAKAQAVEEAKAIYLDLYTRYLQPKPTVQPTEPLPSSPLPSSPIPSDPVPSDNGTDKNSTADLPTGDEGSVQVLEKPIEVASQANDTTSNGIEWSDVEAAKTRYVKLEEEYINYQKEHATEINDLQYKVDTDNLKLKAINNQLSTLGINAGDLEEKEEAMKVAKETYLARSQQYQDALATSNRSIASASAGLSGISNKIKRQQEKIKKLSGEGDENTITANVSGTVTEVNCTAGDSVVKDDILASIEVPDQGYTVSFSVTNDQAKRLHVGDTATISNYYWGNKIVATLATIQTDKKNPMTNKTLTFDLEGDVTSGSEITVSVGQKSANYDTIIPNSAISSDSNGSFVLAVTAKNSPLGNRYIAKRVAIEVLAADDTNSAVTADLNNGDYVITTSSTPVASGDMVRLADAEN